MDMTSSSFSGGSGTAAGPASASGPRILFFSGGTALRETSRELARLNRNTVHLVTPFDSGGSSAALREAFGMPAVGDARSRIMALAEAGREGNSEIFTLFAYRLPRSEPEKRLQSEMVRLVRGSHPLLRQIPDPANGIIREHLAWFALHMPVGFSLAGANIGNLILAAGYLRSNRRLGPVLALFSRLVRARGIVRPIVEEPLHIAARLASGEIVTGQHRITGKEYGGLAAPIDDIWLTASVHSREPVSPPISPRTAKLIRSASCICYPVGSFYSSVVANLLPSGVGRAVAACRGPKIFIPNLGTDPELAGQSLATQIERLLRPLLADAPGSRPKDMLSRIIIDRENGCYPGDIPAHTLASLEIGVSHFPLVPPGKGPLAHPCALANAITAGAEGFF